MNLKLLSFSRLLQEIEIFNFLRGIALLCVIGLHTVCVIEPMYPTIHHSVLFHTPAWMSMWIFFFLSGYLLGKGFYTGKYQTNIRGILGFYVSRFVRIVPMYLLFLFILFLFYNPIWFITNPITVLKLFTFTYNGIPGICGIGALWFVSTIVQLYIISPLLYEYIFSRFNTKSLKIKFIVLMSIILVGLSYRLIINFFKLSYWEYCFTFSLANIDLFFGGMFLNSITLHSIDNIFKKFLRPLSLILLFILIVLYIYDVYSPWVYSWICPTLILVTMLLITYSFDSINKKSHYELTFNNIIKNPLRFIEYLGTISFTFYLYHSNIIKISVELLKNEKFPYIVNDAYLYRYTFMLMFILTFILSVTMHYMLEKPCNNIRKNLLNIIQNK